MSSILDREEDESWQREPRERTNPPNCKSNASMRMHDEAMIQSKRYEKSYLLSCEHECAFKNA